MLFCPKCGSLLKTRQEGNAKVLACSCGYVQRAEGTITDRKAPPAPEPVHHEQKDEGIASEDDEHLPLTDAVCPKCKHHRAHFWLIQTRAGDESETKFLKCEKCHHTWREYD